MEYVASIWFYCPHSLISDIKCHMKALILLIYFLLCLACYTALLRVQSPLKLFLGNFSSNVIEFLMVRFQNICENFVYIIIMSALLKTFNLDHQKYINNTNYKILGFFTEGIIRKKFEIFDKIVQWRILMDKILTNVNGCIIIKLNIKSIH